MFGEKCCEECGESRSCGRAHTLRRLGLAEYVLNIIHPDLTGYSLIRRYLLMPL